MLTRPPDGWCIQPVVRRGGPEPPLGEKLDDTDHRCSMHPDVLCMPVRGSDYGCLVQSPAPADAKEFRS